jgi:hypothetical protein
MPEPRFFMWGYKSIYFTYIRILLASSVRMVNHESDEWNFSLSICNPAATFCKIHGLFNLYRFFARPLKIY